MATQEPDRAAKISGYFEPRTSHDAQVTVAGGAGMAARALLAPWRLMLNPSEARLKGNRPCVPVLGSAAACRSGAAADPEGFRGFRPVIVVLAQRLHNGLALDVFQAAFLSGFGGFRFRVPLPDPNGQVFGKDQLAMAHQDGPFHGVAQFAHISGPFIFFPGN